ncbi:MAG TPA: peptide chain release factor N(5)-glutamine methyltransferase [Vicinamibacterales bacterium]
MTLFEVLAAARLRLIAAGIPADDATVDVPLFASTILGWDRARLIAEHARAAPSSLEPRFSQWIARRVSHEPTAYIVGHREFWGLDFHVTPAVLIPRPETELIVEEALAIVRAAALDAPRIADIGTGSGNLAVSLAHSIAGARVTATDISAAALAVARQNAKTHAVDTRITFVETAHLAGIGDRFDLIVANPPYIREGDRSTLSRGVLQEPAAALFGGPEGLGAIEGVLDAATRSLKTGGWLAMEFGFGQEGDLRDRVAARPTLRLDHIRADLQGIPRTAIIQRAA